MSAQEKRMYRKSLNPPSTPKTKVIRVRLSEEDYQRLKDLSRKKKLCVSALVRHYIARGMKENVLHET